MRVGGRACKYRSKGRVVVGGSLQGYSGEGGGLQGYSGEGDGSTAIATSSGCSSHTATTQGKVVETRCHMVVVSG